MRDIIQTLRRLRRVSIAQSQPSNKIALDQEQWRIASILALAAAMIICFLSNMKQLPISLSLNFAVQIFMVVWSALMACQIYFRKGSLGILYRILLWICIGISLGYVVNLLSYGLHEKMIVSAIIPHMNQLIFYKQWTKIAVMLGAGFACSHLIQIFLSRLKKNNSNKYSFNLWLGTTTGQFITVQHDAGLRSKQQVTLSLSDASQNILVLGAIGSGKTTRAIHPLLLQLLDQQCGGLIFDIKGDFKTAVFSFAKTIQALERLQVIGQGHVALNLIQGLVPEMAASFLKSTLLLTKQSQQDSFWVNTATNLCRNTLGILYFLPKRYNLNQLYQYLFNSEEQENIQREIEQLRLTLSLEELRLLESYVSYHSCEFARFDEKVQSGVLASISEILSPFNHPTLIDLFCTDSPFAMEDVLQSRLFLVDLPLARWGLAGKVAYNFIKLRFFNTMQQRALNPNWNQTQPVFFLCDEYQEIISASDEGLSDLSFWDKSRSSKTIGIVSAQSVSSFYSAIRNHDMANTILQNFRQKICFKTEDPATLILLNQLMGEVNQVQQSISKQSGSMSMGIIPERSSCSETRTTAQVHTAIVQPQLVRNLEPHQAIALLSIQGKSCDDILEMLQVYVNH